MTDTVTLTGISGFLGGHIALELLNSGYHVRGSLRNPERGQAVRRALGEAGADTTRLSFAALDLTRDDGWSEAMEGSRYLVHTASPFLTSMPRDSSELIEPAVRGTERAIGAALKAGIERIVLTSSTVAITNGRGKDGPDRLGPQDWADPDSGRLNPYAESKVRAERRAWEMMDQAGRRADLVVINPGFILGPLLDDDPGTSAAVIQRFLKGEMPAAPDLHLHTVDVRDLARIHVAALTCPEAAGSRHAATFSTASLLDFAAALRENLPDYRQKLPRFAMPDWLVRLYALFDGDVRANIGELGYRPKIDASAALSLLGRSPISFRESLMATAESLIERRLA